LYLEEKRTSQFYLPDTERFDLLTVFLMTFLILSLCTRARVILPRASVRFERNSFVLATFFCCLEQGGGGILAPRSQKKKKKGGQWRQTKAEVRTDWTKSGERPVACCGSLRTSTRPRMSLRYLFSSSILFISTSARDSDTRFARMSPINLSFGMSSGRSGKEGKSGKGRNNVNGDELTHKSQKGDTP